MIDKLLAYDPKVRADFEYLRSNPMYAGVNWSDLRNMDAPFVPQPDDAMDTTYFEGESLHAPVSCLSMAFIEKKNAIHIRVRLGNRIYLKFILGSFI